MCFLRNYCCFLQFLILLSGKIIFFSKNFKKKIFTKNFRKKKFFLKIFKFFFFQKFNFFLNFIAFKISSFFKKFNFIFIIVVKMLSTHKKAENVASLRSYRFKKMGIKGIYVLASAQKIAYFRMLYAIICILHHTRECSIRITRIHS